jgi:dihydroorotase
MSLNPARILNLEGGKIEEGGVADLMIANLDEEWVVKADELVSKGKNTPFDGCKLTGAVKYTIVNGDVKYQA